MKKSIALIILSLFVILPLLIANIATAEAESYATPLPGEVEQVTAPDVSAEPPTPTVPGEPLTWSYLATIAGASALTLLIVQFLKVPLDSVFHIPTRILVYCIALVIMLVATALTTGLTIDNALLVAVNAIIAAVTAYGAYEVTFAKIGTKA